MLDDTNYAREGGKPVVDFFKNDPKYGGNFVIGGIPNNFRHMEASDAQALTSRIMTYP